MKKQSIWSLPRSGWFLEEIEDRDEPEHLCEACEKQEVRYVHHMKHVLGHRAAVGCVCAGKLTGDESGARLAERDFKAEQRRRKAEKKRLLRSAQVMTSARGNEWFYVPGYPMRIVAIKRFDGRYRGVLYVDDDPTAHQGTRVYPDLQSLVEDAVVKREAIAARYGVRPYPIEQD